MKVAVRQRPTPRISEATATYLAETRKNADEQTRQSSIGLSNALMAAQRSDITKRELVEVILVHHQYQREANSDESAEAYASQVDALNAASALARIADERDVDRLVSVFERTEDLADDEYDAYYLTYLRQKLLDGTQRGGQRAIDALQRLDRKYSKLPTLRGLVRVKLLELGAAPPGVRYLTPEEVEQIRAHAQPTDIDPSSARSLDEPLNRPLDEPLNRPLDEPVGMDIKD